MMFDKAQFLSQVSDIRTGSGFLRDIVLPLGAVTWAGTGTPAATLSSGILVVTLGNSDNTGAIGLSLPGDYDGSARGVTAAVVNNKEFPGDHLELLVDAIATTTTTNTLEIDDIRYWRPYSTYPGFTAAGTAVVDPTLTSAQSASQTVSASVFKRYSFPLHGLGLRPQDAVTITLGSTIAGNNILVRGVTLRYRSNLRLTIDQLAV